MSDAVARLNVALAGRYELERELGEGGMATVYLADDLRHERKVAVKVLRPELAATLGPERFLQEIRIAARLTHPHILPVHDSGEAGGFLYYVMPYIEGESLRDRLDREHELPVADALRILREIADALSHAHALGVVHRDIKPANVLLSGRHAMVTDFGVAKALTEATGRQRLTTVGVALGTPAYMAPEQAAADPDIDHRVDIYATGAVGYELLAGRPPFTDKMPQAILGAHVTEEPAPVRTHRASVPPALDHLILRCLAKKPADRWQSAEELIPQLEMLATPSGGVTPIGTGPVAVATPSRLRAGRVAAGLLAVGVLLSVGWLVAGGRGPAAVTVGTTTQVTFDPGLELTPAISPDGRQVAYAVTVPLDRGSSPSRRTRIMVRQVDGGRAVPAAGEGEAAERFPRWRPDGSRVVFDATGRIVEVPPLGGTPAPVFAPPPGESVSEAAWSPDGTRLAYRTDSDGSIHIYDADTGGHRALEGAAGHGLVWSPDGAWIAYAAGETLYTRLGPYFANVSPSAIRLVSPDGGDPVTVVPNDYLNAAPAWLPDGRLLFVSNRGGGRDIYVVSLNRDGSAAGEPQRLTTGLDPHTISVSSDGRTLAYSTLKRRQNVHAIALPARDSVSGYEGVAVTTGPQVIEGVAISPDGRYLAFDSDRSGNQDVFIRQLAGGEPIRVTDHPADEFLHSWSPDGDWVAGHGLRNGNRDPFAVRIDGTGFQHLDEAPTQERYPDWSPAGDRIAFHRSRPGTNPVIFVVGRGAAGWSPPDSVGVGAFARWSPDGTRIAFSSPDGLGTLRLSDGQRNIAWRGRRGMVEWLSNDELVFVMVRADQTSAFMALRLSGGEPRPVVVFNDPLRPPRQEFSIHDGTVYYTYPELEVDVWVMELIWG